MADYKTYYVDIASRADQWARGLTMTENGENLLRMADAFEADAEQDIFTDEIKESFKTLAAALRRHVESVRAFHRENP